MNIDVPSDFPAYCGALRGTIDLHYEKIVAAYGSVAIDDLVEALREIHSISYVMYKDGYLPRNDRT